jgi:diguanylate cyclase (GGDEF)-like protein
VTAERNFVSPYVFRRLLDLVDDAAIVLDKHGTVVWANRAVNDVLGIASNARGIRLEECFRDESTVADILAAPPAGHARARSLVARAIGSGAEVAMSADTCAETGQTILVARRTHEPLSNFDQAIRFATWDPTTRLLNRDAFQDRLSATMQSAAAGSVVCVNGNQFSTINEVYGNAAGDSLLRAVALRLQAVSTPDQCLARLYGGRFALLTANPDTAKAQAAATESATAIHSSMRDPITVAGGVQPITLSIGVATWPDGATEAHELVGAAEVAIRALQRHGDGRTGWFDPAMRMERRRFLEIQSDLRLAIANGQLSLHYQPKVRWSDRSVTGFEALVRWAHPTKGNIPPVAFVPVAEQSSLILDLGNWVLREACRQQAEWRERGLSLLPVAVNVSPQQLLSQSIDTLLAPLSEFGLPSDCIEIEITETAMMDRLSAAGLVIEQLRKSGLHISIDDFGTGHSSLGNLRRLPINVLKIDRSFVTDIESSREDFNIVETIVAMAKALSLDVVAEGVETEGQGKLLRAQGVEIMQGYLFAKPMPAAEAGIVLEAVDALAKSAGPST